MDTKAEKPISFIVTDSPTSEKLAASNSSAENTDQPVAQFKSTKHFLWATTVLIAEALLAVTEGQLGAIGFTTKEYNFDAPFFYTLIRFFARSLAFPIVLTFFWMKSVVTRDKSFRIKSFIRECSQLAPGRDFTTRNFFKYYTLPTITTMGVGVGYMLALRYIPPSVTSASFCSTVALSYVITIVFLKGRHILFKTVFVIFSFAGVAIIAYETTAQQAIREDAWIGVICILISCISLSLHQLFFVQSFPNASSNQVAFSVTIMYAVCVLILWPVPLAFRLLDLEIWYWSQIPWGFVIGAATSSLAVAFLYSYGLALSSPFFMSLGELFDSAIMAVADYLRDLPIGPLQIIGSIIVGVSFIILLIPEERLSVKIRERLPQSSSSVSFDLQSTSSQVEENPKVLSHSYSTTTMLA